MATSGKEVNEPASDVCAICLGTVRDARLLPCLHSFCKSCLDDLDMRTGHDQKITCPVCRLTRRLPESGASGLPKDVTRAVDTENECATCKEEGGQKQLEVCCRTCSLAFCKEHAIPHLLANPDHNLKPFGMKAGMKLSPSERTSTTGQHCKEHGLPLRYYCKQCNTAVCGDCIAFDAHRRHEPIVAVKEIAKELHQRVRHKTANLKSTHIPHVQKSLSAVENVSTELSSRAKSVRARIKSTGKRVTDMVDLVIQQRLVEVEDLEEERLKDLNSQQKELQQHAASLKSVVSFSEKVLKEEVEAEEVCDLLLAIEQRADELEKEIVAEEPVQHSHVDFERIGEEELAVKASELVGIVLPCQASAATSHFEGSSKMTCCVGSAVSFTIIAKDKNGRAFTKGGDYIQVECLRFPDGVGEWPSMEVHDRKNGTYEIRCKPQHVGDFTFKVVMNKAMLQQCLTVSCIPPCSFDATSCQPQSTVSSDKLTFTHTGNDRVWSSVVSSHGMKMGQCMWKVKIARSKDMYIFLGVAEKPGLISKANNYQSSYSWLGKDGRRYFMNNTSETRLSRWQVEDILQLELECDTHTLSITNTRSGEKATITNLPARELFPFFSTLDCNDSIILIQ